MLTSSETCATVKSTGYFAAWSAYTVVRSGLKPLMSRRKGRDALPEKLVRDLLLPFYERLSHFFQTIFADRNQYDYVVFIARRCSNLAELFYRLNWAVKASADSIRFPANFINDSALLAQAGRMAEVYRQTGRFPRVLLADDIVIYGRSLSAFLEEMENLLCSYLTEYDRETVIAAWLRAVDIRAFARNNQPLLLTSRYQPNFTVMQTVEPKQWRDLSNRISRLIQLAGWVNSSFVSGADVSSTKSKEDWDTLQVKGFTRVDTNYDFFPQTLFYREVVISSNIYAIYTVRLFPSMVTGGLVAAPFVFLPDLPEEGVENLIQLSLAQLRPQLGATPLDPGGSWENCPRTRLEALSLLLSSSLLNEFCCSAELIPAYNGQIKLAMNYGTELDAEADRFVVRMMNPAVLLSLGQMDGLFTICAGMPECRPITPAGETDWLLPANNDALKKCVEDAVYQISLKNYTRSYIQTQICQSEPPEEMETPDYFVLVGRLLQLLSASLPKHPLSQLFGWLFQLLDAGILAVAVRMVSRNGARYASQCAKTGEQSQFILPKRYREFIPVLVFIQKKSYILNRNFCGELKRFAEVNTNVRESYDDLVRFIEGLWNSGQDLKDWDFNLLSYPNVNSKNWMKELEASVRILQVQREYMRDYSNMIRSE